MTKKSFKWFALSAVLCAPSVFAATLQISGGTLTGATGVNVNGSYYDVSFVDGSCNSLFSGCINSAFTFNTIGDATAAAQALLSQVLLGAFDDRSANTRGCNAGGSCSILTPYNHTLPYDLSAMTTYNAAIEASDQVFGSSITPTISTTASPTQVFAVWTPVPVPAAAWLFGSGMLALAGLGRRRSR